MSSVGCDSSRSPRSSRTSPIHRSTRTTPTLRLHLLSHRLVAAPRVLNLDGIFGVLNNVIWTSAGPCPVEDFEQARLRLRAARPPVEVFGLDKFPRMTDYVVPRASASPTPTVYASAPTSRAGTTVMHEGFVNFNAGTLGTSMVEGRITPGRRRRRRFRHRRRRVDHGHALGRRQGDRVDRRTLPARRERRASASRSATTASSRPGSTSPPARGSRCPTARSSRPASCRASRTCCTGATRCRARSRFWRDPASGAG